MTTVLVSTFFAPGAPKRPPNFVVVKYFLLGLLISNSIESVLIIPKILDVLDQSAIQAKAIQEMDIRKTELKELMIQKEKEARELEKERERELNVLLKETGAKGKHINEEDIDEDDDDETNEQDEHQMSKHHPKKGKTGNSKHSSKSTHNNSKQHESIEHEVRKRPQRLATGNNIVAVFMLFYGSATLCLGVPAIFRESIILLRCLIYLSCLGTGILITSEFSLIMLISVVKDIAIAALTFYYLQMIVASNPPGDGTGATAASTAAPAAPVVADGVTFAPTAATVPVDYSQVAPQQVYTGTGQVTSNW